MIRRRTKNGPAHLTGILTLYRSTAIIDSRTILTRWEYRFLIDGVFVPKDNYSVGKEIVLQKLEEHKARILIRKETSDSESNVARDMANELVVDFLSAYLAAGGYTGLTPRLIKDEGGSGYSRSGSQTIADGEIRRFTVYKPMSEEDSLRALNETNDLLESSQCEESLRLALRQYYQALLANRAPDKFLLYFIALEALYMTGIEELSYRLSQRIALMLGDSEERRNVIFQDIRKLYAKRGKIVHGYVTKPSKEEVDSLGKYVRESILKFHQFKRKGLSKDKVIELLEDIWKTAKTM